MNKENTGFPDTATEATQHHTCPTQAILCGYTACETAKQDWHPKQLEQAIQLCTLQGNEWTPGTSIQSFRFKNNYLEKEPGGCCL